MHARKGHIIPLHGDNEAKSGERAGIPTSMTFVHSCKVLLHAACRFAAQSFLTPFGYDAAMRPSALCNAAGLKSKYTLVHFLAILCLLGPADALPASLFNNVDDPFSTGSLTSASPANRGGTEGGELSCAFPPDGKNALELVGVIEHALCNNPQTRQAWAAAKAQAAQVGVAESAYLPSLTLPGRATRSFASSTNTSSSLAQTLISATPVLNYLLFDFGGRNATLESARQSLAAANWTQNATLQNVFFSAVQDYYLMFAAQATIISASEAEKSSLEAMNAAESRYKAGAATPADKLQAQTAYAQAKLNRIQAEGNAQIAKGTLANIIGIDPDYGIEILPPRIQEPDEGQEQKVHELIVTAKQQRPDLAAAEAKVNATLQNIKSAEASGKPAISLFTNYGYSHSNIIEQPQTMAMGVSINFPIFTGFNNTYQIRAARAQAEASAAQRDLVKNQVALDAWNAYHTLNTTKETLKSTADLVASATQAERVALGRYKAGAGTILDLLTAQTNLANARLQRIQSQYNWYVAKAKLAQAIGRLDFSTIASSTQ